MDMEEQVTTKRRDVDDVSRTLWPWLSSRLNGRRLDDLQIAAPSGHGFSNDTFMVEATVNGDVMPLVLQAAPTGEGLFPEYPIQRMAAIQSDLRDHSDVPVPNVRWFEADCSILGAPFYVMDRVVGQVVDESPTAYHAVGWVHEASTEQRRRLWTSMLEAMGRLHRLDVAAHFDYLTTTRWGMALGADPAAERVNQWRDYTVWASDDDELPPNLMRAWDTLAKVLPPRPQHLSIGWGDAKLGNIMFSDFTAVALIDWELCGVGPAEEDLMNQLAVDDVLADMSQVARIDGFLSREETVAAYEDIMQREMVGANWWYVFCLAKMAAEIHRILRQSRKLGAIPADLELEAANVAMPRLSEALTTL
jgi:aminoglycoside phosphotransferase (APT) family kinase protein